MDWEEYEKRFVKLLEERKAHLLVTGLLLSVFSNSGMMMELPALHPLCSTAAARTLYERTGEHYFPTEFKKSRKYHTFDTNENRFIKHFLKGIGGQVYD